MNYKNQFDELHRKYHPMVLQLCMGYSKGAEAIAKDLSQDVFINIWHALPAFEKRSSFKTWIYRITVNTCLMQIRKDKKMSTEQIGDQHMLPVNIEEVDKSYGSLYAAIGKLTEVDRLLMMLLLDELSYDEIAEVMGIKAVNLRVKIYRVKERLKKILANG
ncbi:MAG: RNA polymerase sigma factor (sigma-70 family) [Marivirga sp.]|jgi:RNA polymerase sigma factor (sigma-70 family)